jgi:hypothetical protein
MDLAQTDDPQERLEFALSLNTCAVCSSYRYSDYDDQLTEPSNDDIQGWAHRVAPIFFSRGWRGGPNGSELICPRSRASKTSV